MTKKFFSQQNTTSKRIFAGLLAFWMSGLLFVFCSELPKAQASEAEICPLSKKAHCAKASNNQDLTNSDVLEPTLPVLNCCQFLPLVFDKSRKLEQTPELAVITPKLETKSPAFLLIKTEFNNFQNYQSSVLNRSNTYLKNRVFRI